MYINYLYHYEKFNYFIFGIRKGVSVYTCTFCSFTNGYTCINLFQSCFVTNNKNLVFQERDGSKCLCALGVGPFPLWQWVISDW